MRYLTLKGPVEESMPTGEKFKISTKMMFEGLISAQVQLDPMQFLRIGNLYQKFSKLSDEAVLEMEDQDYDILKLKLTAYIKHISVNAPANIMCKTFCDFVSAIQDLPKEKLALVGEA